MINTHILPAIDRCCIEPLVCSMICQNFAAYVNLFQNGDQEYDKHINLKRDHTQQVCNEMRLLADSLDMTEEELSFCESIAWLHDIGRFEQYDKFKTFADAESENHAELGIKVIDRLDLLQGFNDVQKVIIYESIKNHNIARLPENLSDEVDFYSRLLRDADKLDIWRVTLEFNIFHRIKNEEFPAIYQVPEHLMLAFENREVIRLNKVDSFYDSILFRLSWIYDLSFPHSLKMVKERNIIQQLLTKLPHSEDLAKIESLCLNYISESLI